MGFEEDHQRRVASFPDDVRVAHTRSSHHRSEVLASDHCGCFYCCKTFSPGEITEWVDEIDEVGQTALCPRCGIDSVLGAKSGFEMSTEFLRRMKTFWF
jgi:hypothetical protein